MTDVFGLCAFDRSEPVIRVLPSDFSNTIRILVPDVAATPVAFQDILIENIKSMPHQVNGISEFDLTEETLVVLAVCGHASSSGRDGDRACKKECDGESNLDLPVLYITHTVLAVPAHCRLPLETGAAVEKLYPLHAQIYLYLLKILSIHTNDHVQGQFERLVMITYIFTGCVM